jgi:uncharacterized membrane protein
MVDEKVVDYIKTSLGQGKTKEELYKELLDKGWTIENIQENFNAINGSSDVQEKEDTSKKTINIIVTIGAILIGAGIFSLIASNWQEMTRSTKVIVILISMLISYSVGWYLKEKSNLPKTGQALILLGAIIYGAGIFLIAQMFNIRANWPDGFILWMIGVVVMAFAVESYSLFYLAILLGVVALIGHPFSIFTSFDHNSFLLTSSLLLFVSTIITFIAGWIVRKRMPLEFKDYY